MTEQGRRDAFDARVAAVADPVRRYLLRRTDAATADDVLAETLVVLWRREAVVPDDVVPWAIGVARLQLRNAERAARRQGRLVARIGAIDPPRETAEGPDPALADDVREVIALLRAGDAEVLRLWAWDELSPVEIAAVLGISANAATVRLHRARARFARHWTDASHHARERDATTDERTRP